jgi:hypothetical protein
MAIGGAGGDVFVGDPKPEPFDWGSSKWATEQVYDVDLADLLGDLACGAVFAPVGRLALVADRTYGLAQRALYFRPDTFRDEPARLWPRLFAARVLHRLPSGQGAA